LSLIAKKIGPFPISFFVLVIFAIVFITLLSKTTFGRKLYAIGSNQTAAKYAGINVQGSRFFCFSLLGFLSGVSALFLLSTLYGANTTTGNGFEMEVIAMCVFGGIASTGGKGTLVGGIIAGLIITLLRIALGQANVNSQMILVIVGALLIIAVLIPGIKAKIDAAKKLKAIS
jgi:rhamnose transport system permease protein